MTCPICKNPVPPRDENRAFPFCSERCRLVDLGGWLGETYRVAPSPEDEKPARAIGHLQLGAREEAEADEE